LSRRYPRLILALPALCATALALTGCQGRKIVARVNAATITEEEYLNRTQYVHANQFPQTANMDAGGVTLMSMIQDSLTDQLAAEQNYKPSEQAIKQLTEIVRRSTPQIEEQIVTNQMTEEDVYRLVRRLIEITALGTEGAKADPQKVQQMYDDMSKKAIYPATYSIRVLFVTDPVKAKDVMDQLKASKDFKKAAQNLNLQPAEIANAGREVVLPKEGAPPELVKALDALGNGPFTPENGPFTSGPVAITQPPNPNNPTGMGNTVYLIAQLIGKQAEEKPPLDKIRPYLEQRVLQQTQPQWQMHAQQKIGEYTRKAYESNQIQINIERYKPLLESVIMAQANAHAEATAPPMSGGPGAAPGGAPAPGPGGPPSGAPSAPPTGSNGAAPGGAPGAGKGPNAAAPTSGGAPGASK